MIKFQDYKCKLGTDSGGLEEDVIERVNLDLPKGYTTVDGMVKIAKANKESKGMSTCLLPFCHTVEAENYGANINLGDEKIGPRCGGNVCHNSLDLLNLPDLDFNKGRLASVIKAIEVLKSQGESVTVNITGPMTILNNLMNPSKIFKIWRKEGETISAVVEKLKFQTLKYIEKVLDVGADIIAFEDPVGALNIIGPKYFEAQGGDFAYPFVKDAIDLIGNRGVLHLCPKTTLQLISLGFADWYEIKLDEDMSYEEAYIKNKDDIVISGSICIHERNLQSRGKKLKTLRLK